MGRLIRISFASSGDGASVNTRPRVLLGEGRNTSEQSVLATGYLPGRSQASTKNRRPFICAKPKPLPSSDTSKSGARPIPMTRTGKATLKSVLVFRWHTTGKVIADWCTSGLNRREAVRSAPRKSPDNPAGPLAYLPGELLRTTVPRTWCCFIRLVIVGSDHRALVHTASPYKRRFERLEPCASKRGTHGS